MKKILALFSLMVVLTACGGGGGGRPSTADIEKALKDKTNPVGSSLTAAGDSAGAAAVNKAIDCIAKVLEDSDLSDSALKALVKGDSSFEGNKDDSAVLSKLAPKFEACFTP